MANVIVTPLTPEEITKAFKDNGQCIRIETNGSFYEFDVLTSFYQDDDGHSACCGTALWVDMSGQPIGMYSAEIRFHKNTNQADLLLLRKTV